MHTVNKIGQQGGNAVDTGVMDTADDPEPFTLDDFRRGLELLAAESPENWWGGFHDIDHPGASACTCTLH